MQKKRRVSSQLKKIDSTEKMNPRLENLYGIFENEPIPDKKEIRKALHITKL